MVGYVRGWRAGVRFLYEPANREAAEALLVANVPAMTPQLARQSLQVLLDDRRGFFREPAVDMDGLATVLALRSKYGEPRKLLSDPAKYVDHAYVKKAEER